MADRSDGFATDCVIAGAAVTATIRPATRGHARKRGVASLPVYFRL
jgi:hypothetical protein